MEELARVFVYSLIPIALAYHLAHFLSFLLVQGQAVIPLASDPFGSGWDLLGTAEYTIDIGVVGARFAWFTAVIGIVAGHIIAVYLAHAVALRTLGDPLGDRGAALRSQYPMLALMVGYTMLSLWILAQPIVESGRLRWAGAFAWRGGESGVGWAHPPTLGSFLVTGGTSPRAARRPRRRGGPSGLPCAERYAPLGSGQR